MVSTTENQKSSPIPDTSIQFFKKGHKGAVPLAEYENLLKHYYAQQAKSKDLMRDKGIMQAEIDRLHNVEAEIEKFQTLCEMFQKHRDQANERAAAISGKLLDFSNPELAVKKCLEEFKTTKVKDMVEFVKQLSANVFRGLSKQVAMQQNDYEFNNKQLEGLKQISTDIYRDQVFFEPGK